jgi:CelD/BcsL family acetyltransferase involved in cellulose biosynthesis
LSLNAVAKLKSAKPRLISVLRSASSPMASTSSITIITDVSGLLALEHDWRRLERHNTTVFQSFDWNKTWCDAYLPDDKVELQIVVGKTGNSVVFILPLVKTRKSGLNILDWLTDPIGQYGDALCASSQNPNYWLKIAFATLAARKNIDVIRLRHVRDTATIAEFAKHELHDAKYYERAPYLDLTLFKTEADYEARYTSTQRKRRKKIRKSLEDMGGVSFTTLSKGQMTDTAIDEAIAEKNAWLSDRGRFNRIMGCAKHVTFLKNLSRIATPDFNVQTSEIKAGEKPVSWEIGFRYQGTHFAYITSHVNALTNLSPGRLHMDLSQRKALAEGQTQFDLMVPYDLHKESWSSGTIATNDYFKPITLRGALYGHFYLRTLRPLVRKLYYKLPTKALLMLQPFTRA